MAEAGKKRTTLRQRKTGGAYGSPAKQGGDVKII